MSNLNPSGYTNTYDADTAAKLIGFCNTPGFPRAGVGDLIRVTANVDVSATPLNPRAGVTLDMGGQTVTGQFLQDSGGHHSTLKLRNGTVDSSGLNAGTPAGGIVYGANHFQDGQFDFVGVTFTGDNHTGGKNMLTFDARNYPCKIVMERCHVEQAEYDCISTKASSAALGNASVLRLYNCEANNSGSGAVYHQVLTSHTNFHIFDFYGYYHSPESTAQSTQLIAQADGDCPIVLNGTVCVGGVIRVKEAYNCDITLQNHPSLSSIGLMLVSDDSFAVGNTIRGAGSYGGYGIRTNDIAGAVIKGNTVVDIQYATGGGISVSAGSTGMLDVADNTITNCVRGIDARVTDGSSTVRLLGNRVADGGGYLVLTAAGPTIVSKMNIYEADDFSVYADTAADLILNP